jgi:hypothetical protein
MGQGGGWWCFEFSKAIATMTALGPLADGQLSPVITAERSVRFHAPRLQFAAHRYEGDGVGSTAPIADRNLSSSLL